MYVLRIRMIIIVCEMDTARHSREKVKKGIWRSGIYKENSDGLSE